MLIICQFSPGRSLSGEVLKRNTRRYLDYGWRVGRRRRTNTYIHLPCTSPRFCSSYITTLRVSSVYRGIVVGGSVGINAQVACKRTHEHVRCTYLLRRWRRMRRKKNTRRRYERCGRTRSAYENRRLIAPETRNTRVSLSSSRVTRVDGVYTTVVGLSSRNKFVFHSYITRLRVTRRPPVRGTQ